MSRILSIRYYANYLTTVTDNTHHSVADIPFPAVTLCHYNRIDSRKVNAAIKRFDFAFNSVVAACTWLAHSISPILVIFIHQHTRTNVPDFYRTPPLLSKRCSVSCWNEWMDFDSGTLTNSLNWEITTTGLWTISIYRICIILWVSLHSPLVLMSCRSRKSSFDWFFSPICVCVDCLFVWRFTGRVLVAVACN